MKSFYRWLSILAPVFFLLFAQEAFGGARVTKSRPELFSRPPGQLVFSVPAGHAATSFLDEEVPTEHVKSRIERKKRCRYLVRQVCYSHYLRKGGSKVYNFSYPPAEDPDHEPAPDEIWLTRPRYYVFLFRLCPF